MKARCVKGWRWVHRNVTYPTIVTLRAEGTVFRRLRELRAVEHLSVDELRHRQAQRLSALLSYAWERTPFYRAHWGGGFRSVRPEDAVAALETLPTVSKAEVQRAYEKMLAKPRPRRVTRKVTGGSTGQAVTVIKDRAATAAEMAASWLGLGWFGISVGDRAVRFWGNPRSLKRRLRFAAADFAMHRIRLSAFAFDETHLRRYWQRCKRFRPDYFYGYVSMLEAFARFIDREGLDGRELGLEAIVTTAEVLTETQQALLSETFGAPVQNEYGCGEVGPIAYTCERGSLHLMTENHLVEILTPDGQRARAGDVGEVVVTDLCNHAMPLIRYRVGDLAVSGDGCGCGRGFPVLERVWGRSYDFVQTPGGRRYHGEFFMYLFEDLRGSGAGVDQFQVVQSAPGALEVQIVAGNGDSENRRTRVLQEFRRRLPELDVDVRVVTVIPRRPSGKAVVVENRWLRAAAERTLV